MMLKKISIILLIGLFLATAFPNKAFGWPMSNEGANDLLIGGLVMTAFVFIIISPVLFSDSRKTGWIESTVSTKEGIYIIGGIPPKLTFMARIVENSTIYSSPSKVDLIGQVHVGEKFVVEEDVENNEGHWHKIMFNPVRSLPSE